MKLPAICFEPDDYLIAADGGANHLLKMGILPEIVIGDLDSVDEDTLFQLTSAEVNIEQYSEDKNETDIELALRYAIELQPTSILIVGALGGRLDQTLANLSILTDPTLSGTDIRLDDGVEEAFFLPGSRCERGAGGSPGAKRGYRLTDPLARPGRRRRHRWPAMAPVR